VTANARRHGPQRAPRVGDPAPSAARPLPRRSSLCPAVPRRPASSLVVREGHDRGCRSRRAFLAARNRVRPRETLRDPRETSGPSVPSAARLPCWDRSSQTREHRAVCSSRRSRARYDSLQIGLMSFS
jgi:hypothetical protein